MIYDVPFILIKFHEVGDPSVINLNKDNLLNVKKFININENNRNLSINTSIKEDNNTKVLTNETKNKSIISSSFKIIHFQHKIKVNQSFFEKYIKEIICFFICCLICAYIFILIYQLNVVNNCYNIFLAFYYNYVQRDRLVNLHSAIISGYYYFANLVDYSEYIPINKYQKYIIDNAQKFSESFHTFYQNYIN